VAVRAWRRLLDPGVSFLLIGGFFGLALLVISPPLYWGDENTHFLHAYRLSELSFALTPTEDGGMAALLPRGVGKLQLLFGLDRLQRERGTAQLSVRQVLDRLAVVATPADRRAVQVVNSNYPPLGYVPQALGIACARLFTSSVLLQLYAARLGNLAVWLLLVWAAIRTAPAFKVVLAVVALSPISVFVASSCAADALTNALALLWTALIVRLAIDPRPAGTATFAVVGGVAVALSLVKVLYGPLVLQLLAVPVEHLGGREQHSRRLRALLLVVAAAYATWVALSFWQISRGLPHRGVEVLDENLAALAQEPLHVARMIAASMFLSTDTPWIYDVTSTMWGATTPSWLLWVWLAAMSAALLSEQRRVAWPSWHERATLLAPVAICMLAIALGAFLFWTPAHADVIGGYRGRYIIPLLPAMCVVLSPHSTGLSIRAREGCATAALLLTSLPLGYAVGMGLRLYG
jgi:hypothetical protein